MGERRLHRAIVLMQTLARPRPCCKHTLCTLMPKQSVMLSLPVGRRPRHKPSSQSAQRPAHLPALPASAGPQRAQAAWQRPCLRPRVGWPPAAPLKSPWAAAPAGAAGRCCAPVLPRRACAACLPARQPALPAGQAHARGPLRHSPAQAGLAQRSRAALPALSAWLFRAAAHWPALPLRRAPAPAHCPASLAVWRCAWPRAAPAWPFSGVAVLPVLPAGQAQVLQRSQHRGHQRAAPP